MFTQALFQKQNKKNLLPHKDTKICCKVKSRPNDFSNIIDSKLIMVVFQWTCEAADSKTTLILLTDENDKMQTTNSFWTLSYQLQV